MIQSKNNINNLHFDYNLELIFTQSKEDYTMKYDWISFLKIALSYPLYQRWTPISIRQAPWSKLMRSPPRHPKARIFTQAKKNVFALNLYKYFFLILNYAGTG